MTLKTTQNSFKYIVNKAIRQPQRIEVTTVNRNVTTVQETFKNKVIINVCANINNRFLNRI